MENAPEEMVTANSDTTGTANSACTTHHSVPMEPSGITYNANPTLNAVQVSGENKETVNLSHKDVPHHPNGTDPNAQSLEEAAHLELTQLVLNANHTQPVKMVMFGIQLS